ncbi:MAG: enoyl-CoA hydratase/isomerase family protein [Alphaproteobacteria bacterium]|nr:enoyl-CoA hydratase/isomerase family protein [Alphaproteobacteria bacterium]
MDEIRSCRERLEAVGGEGEVRLDTSGPVLRLVLDNPGARNALSGRMLGQLDDAVAALEALVQDPTCPAVGLLVRGEGTASFCAGADLRLVRQQVGRPEMADALSRFGHHLTERIRCLPLISVAVIEGAAIGGGAELATACDLRVMGEGAILRFVQAKLGLVPGWAGGVRLVDLVGRRQALSLLGTARGLSAAEAVDIGIADATGPDGEAEDAARRLLEPYLANPAVSVRAAKQLVANAEGLPRAQAMAQERALFGALWGGPANRAALARSRSGRR